MHLVHIQIIPQVLDQSWKRWQHRVGLSAYLYPMILLVLSAILQLSNETGYCFWSPYWLQSLWRCCLFAAVVLSCQVRRDPNQGSASPRSLFCSHWNGCDIPQLELAVKEGPLTWSGEFFGVFGGLFLFGFLVLNSSILMGLVNRC